MGDAAESQGDAGTESQAPSTPGSRSLGGSFSTPDGRPRAATRRTGRKPTVIARKSPQAEASTASLANVFSPPRTSIDGGSVAGDSEVPPGRDSPASSVNAGASTPQPALASFRSRVGGIASPNFSNFSKKAGGLLQAAAQKAADKMKDSSHAGVGGPSALESGAHDRVIRMTKTSPSEPLGLTLEGASLVIKTVEPGGCAARAGLEPGMRLVGVQSSRVTSFDELRVALGALGGLTIDVTIAAERAAMWEAAQFESLQEEEGRSSLSSAEFAAFHKELNVLRKTAAEFAVQRREIEPLRHRAQHLSKVAEEKEKECRRLSELVAKSKAAGEVAQLEAMLEQREEQHQQDIASFKQAQAAVKVSLRDLRSQNQALRARLGEGDEDGALPSAMSMMSGSPEDMERAVELEREQERGREMQAELAKAKKQVDAFSSTVEKLQADLKQQDKDTKTARSQADDLRGENVMLHEEMKRMSRQVQELTEQKEEIVSEMMIKVKNVGHDKDGHLRQASDMLCKVQEECEDLRKRLGVSEKAGEELRTKLQAAEESAKGSREKEAEFRQKCKAAERELEDLRNAKQALEEAKIEEKEAQIEHMESELRRLRNILEERTAVLERAEVDNAALRKASAEDAARITELSEVAEKHEELGERFELEHAAALSLADILDDLEAKHSALEDTSQEACSRAATLEGDLTLARQALENAEDSRKSLEAAHAAEIEDKEKDLRIGLKLHESRIRELQRELKDAKGRAEKLSRLEGRLRGHTQIQSPGAGHHTPSPRPRGDDIGEEKDLGTHAPSYLELSDQNAHLLDQLSALQEKWWASEQCKKALQEDIVRRQQELDKKSAVLKNVLQGRDEQDERGSPTKVVKKGKGVLGFGGGKHAGGQASDMQGVIEEMMYENIRLRDANTKLQKELADLSPKD
eukprot:Hpha_TRINITY_DN10275_c0_g1::TRINITY_DN10275_c0_g1_i1::g.35223::m.35223